MLAAALGAGARLADAARLANVAAGIVVGKVGTAVVEPTELDATLLDRDTDRAPQNRCRCRWRSTMSRAGGATG